MYQDSLRTTNYVELIGTIEQIDVLHSGKSGDSVIELRIERLTPGKSDLVKIGVQNNNIPYIEVGMKVHIKGILYMYWQPHKSFAKHKIRVMCKCMEIVDIDTQDMNYVSLHGTVSKLGMLRVTPVSEKLVIDFHLKTRSWKEEKIPVIAWGRDAQFIDNLYLNFPEQEFSIVGRLQERFFEKTFSDGRQIVENVYEVSARSICIA